MKEIFKKLENMEDEGFIRTDLALEAGERFDEDDIKISGVDISEKYIEEKDIKITTVVIESKEGARAMNKPMGTYVTLEAPEMLALDEDYHREISVELAKQLKKILPFKKKDKNILVVGLGNRDVTADALGPFVVDNLFVTRHIAKEYGKDFMGGERVNLISCIAPGVMAQTGMETVEIIKGIVDETTPDIVVAIDALAARSTKRLNSTIQITDTGIMPGSGVGNHRCAIGKDTLNVPVIAIGVPTVVDAATIVNDTMENLCHVLDEIRDFRSFESVFSRFDGEEKYNLIREIISPRMNGMYVTPKDIDATIKRLSYTISEAINMAVV